VYRDSGGPDEPEDAEAAALDGVYGPDDPAYGPPDPSWYDRQQEEDEAARRQAEELQHARGAFEPLRHADSAGQGYHAEAGYQALGDEAPASLLMVDEDEGEDEGGRGEDEGGRGAAAGSEAALSEAALAQIKDLYMTAEAIGEENLGKHYERLLERQRQLISEYFKGSGFGDSGASQVSVSGENPQ
jgi:hypothetical protein